MLAGLKKESEKKLPNALENYNEYFIYCFIFITLIKQSNLLYMGKYSANTFGSLSSRARQSCSEMLQKVGA